MTNQNRKHVPGSGLTGRVVAGLIAAVVGAHLVFGLVTGNTYSTPRSGAFFDRADTPGLYWAYIALGLFAGGYFLAVAIGVLSVKSPPVDAGAYRRRRQRDGTIFTLLLWVGLVYFWVVERGQFGDARSHAIFGLTIPALLGFIGLLAPLPSGAAGRWLRPASILLMTVGFLGMYYV